MKKILVLIFFTSALLSYSQTIRFNKYYNVGAAAYGYRGITLSDGYIVAGFQDDDSTLQWLKSNPLVIKTNLLGDTVWSKKFGYSGWDVFQDMCKTSDSNYICVGPIQDSIPVNEYDYDLYIVKINPLGDTLWTKRYSSPADSSFAPWSVIETHDKNIIIAGYQYSWADANLCSMIFKLDSLGNLIWRKRYISPNPYPNNSNYILNWIFKLKETNDNCLIAAGGKGPDPIGDPAIFKLDSTGKVLWCKTYGGTDNDGCMSIEKTFDNNFISAVIYHDINQPHKICFLKVDTNGNIIWQKNYSHFYSGGFSKAIPTIDGGYVGVGGSDGDDTNGITHGFIIKIDANGDSLWMRYFNSTLKWDLFWDIEQTPDKGFILTGATCEFNYPGSSVWLVKVDSLGLLVPLGINEELLFPTAMLGNAFPNPTNANCTINCNIPEFKSVASILLFNMQGKQLGDFPLQKGENTVQLNLSNYAAGTYLYVLAIDNYNVKSGKILKN